jgi:class 3 adenylate cyclase
LLAALGEGEIELIYDIARDELREVLPGPDAAAQAGLRRAAFVRFFAADGHLMQPPAAGAEFGAPAGNAAGILRAVRAALRSGRGQDFGWATAGDNGDRLYEVVVTGIDDPIEHERLGALVLGFDATPAAGADTGQARDVDLGLMVGDDLHVAGLAAADRKALGAVIRERVRSGASGTLRAALGGVPHLVLLEELNASPSFPRTQRVGLYSLEAAMAESRTLRNRALVLLALALGGGLIAGAALAHGLAIPVRNLAGATERIRSGDLAARVPVRSRDELGRLSESFNEMAEGLAQKERYRRVLDVVADREVAEQLMSGDLVLGGETREVSIVFCDIRGFTSLARSLSAQEVVTLLNEHMTALTRVVYEHNGVVDKFVGDLLMAVFGAPKSYGNDTLSAVRCAEQMIRERERLNACSRYRVDVGVAVATGAVVAGCTGSADRLSYTVLGTPVNLVSRLCDLAEPMEVLVDESTRARVDGMVELAFVRAAELKGFDTPVNVYRVAAAPHTRAAKA